MRPTEQRDGVDQAIEPIEEAAEESSPASHLPARSPVTAVGPPASSRTTGSQIRDRRDTPMTSPGTHRQSVTDGVADWLSQLVEDRPGLAPPWAGDRDLESSASAWLHRYVREVVTVNSVTVPPFTHIQIFLIESALDCVDWDVLARDPRFRDGDWSRAWLTNP